MKRNKRRRNLAQGAAGPTAPTSGAGTPQWDAATQWGGVSGPAPAQGGPWSPPGSPTWTPPVPTGPATARPGLVDPGASPQYTGPAWIPPQPAATRPPLRRATARSADMPTPWLAGVCSGLAVHLGVPVWGVRTVVALLVPALGIGVLLYLWLLVMVPADDYQARVDSGRLAPTQARIAADRSRVTARNQILLAGIGVLAAALLVLVVATSQTLRVRDMVGVPLVIGGLALAWSQTTHVRNWRSPVVLSSIGGGLIMVITGILLVSGRSDSIQVMLRGGMIGALVVLGVGIALAPLWMRFSRDMSATREEQVRDQERADIAAHLHDSVLQTLTLIRQGADDPARVRSLALTQERELRSWLYTGREQAAESLAQAVRDAVGQVESTHGQAVDVVTVGDTVPNGAELALVAATAEAVTNAVRHAAPPFSVYVEVGPGGVDAFVKDAGEGFDVDAIPEDRHGVRHSIIGRMERAGGTADIRPMSRGTEIHLHLPPAADATIG